METERWAPGSIGVPIGLQSDMPKHLSASMMYWHCESEIWRLEQSQMISTPRRNVVGPKLRNLKWEASSLMAESIGNRIRWSKCDIVNEYRNDDVNFTMKVLCGK